VSRALRRAEVARFRREATRGTVSYLVEPSDPRLEGEPLLRNALNYWRGNIHRRHPICFGCKAKFADDAEVGAFLMTTPSVAPTSASVSALCKRCWSVLTDVEIEAAATRCLRPVMPNGFDTEAP
jgi:hypothetical protein